VFAKVDEGKRALVATGSISFDVGVLQYDLFRKYFLNVHKEEVLHRVMILCCFTQVS
jgi:hypothetical protein